MRNALLILAAGVVASWRTRSRRLRQGAAMLSAVLACALVGAQSGHSAIVLDDALQGSTTGMRSGCALVSGGWQVTGQHDTICHVKVWDLAEGPTLVAARFPAPV